MLSIVGIAVFVLPVALGLVHTGLAGSLWAADPFVGTCKLNVAKSRSPLPLPKSQVTKVEAQGEGYKSTSDTVETDGRDTHTEWVGKLDGKDYPVKGGQTDFTIAARQIDANTLEEIEKIKGKEVLRLKVTVSEDGKTITATGKGTDAMGKEFTMLLVCDK